MRRSTARLKTDHFANLYLDRIPYTARIDNISSSGVALSRLSGPQRLDVQNAELELVLPHRDELIRIGLAVAWTDKSRRMGGQFFDLARRYRSTLERFLSDSWAAQRNLLKGSRPLCQYRYGAVHLESD